MATKSFLKTIDIQDKTMYADLAEALSKTETLKGKEVFLKSKHEELHGDAVKEFIDGYMNNERI